MLYNLHFGNKTILLCFFSFFLIIDLCFLSPAAIAQIFNPTVELVTSTGIPIKEAKTEIPPVIVKAKIRRCSI